MTKIYDITHDSAAYENDGVCPTLQARMGTGGNQVPITIYDGPRLSPDGSIREHKVSPTLCAGMGQFSTIIPMTFGIPVLMDQGGQYMTVDYDRTGTLTAQISSHAPCIPVDCRNALRDPEKTSGTGVGQDGDPAFCVTSGGAVQAVCAPTITTSSACAPESYEGIDQVTSVHQSCAQVRRLTPVECERLQGFADLYTRIPWRGKAAENCPDAPRYKAIGNSWAVPVVRWIGTRIQKELEASNAMAEVSGDAA